MRKNLHDPKITTYLALGLAPIIIRILSPTDLLPLLGNPLGLSPYLLFECRCINRNLTWHLGRSELIIW